MKQSITKLPDYSFTRLLRDCVRPPVRVLLVGINPGIRSAAIGHHFAGPSNRFWKLLFDAGLVPEPIGPEDDGRLPEWGLGITNLIPRCTRGSTRCVDRNTQTASGSCAARSAASSRQSSPSSASRCSARCSGFRRAPGHQMRPAARAIRRRAGVRAAQPERPQREFLLRRDARVRSGRSRAPPG